MPVASLGLLAALLLQVNTLLAQEIVVGRDSDGGLTIQATRYTGQVEIDGILDEEVYQELAPISDFIQQIPDEGAPASERTEAWVFFDDFNLYVAGPEMYLASPRKNHFRAVV